MYEEKFTKWARWLERKSLGDMKYPGIYVCALADGRFETSASFKWINQIIYIGMTNSTGGLQARLKQFDNTILGKSVQHGGADRVRYKHQDYQKLVNALFVSVAPFSCDVTSDKPDDLRVMGDVAKFEYDCFAEFVKIHGTLPEFNNKKSAPKYSLTIGRRNAA